MTTSTRPETFRTALGRANPNELPDLLRLIDFSSMVECKRVTVSQTAAPTIVLTRRAAAFRNVRVTAAAGVPTAGIVTGTAGPFQLLLGEHTDIKVDGGAAQVFTWSGTHGYKTAGAGVFAGVVGSLNLRFNEDASTDQTITFDGSENSLAKALQRINDTILGGTALDDGTGKVKIISDRYGTGSAVRILVTSTGALLTDLGYATGLGSAGTATCDPGSGAVSVTIANLASASAAEIAAAITTAGGITGATMSAVGAALRLTGTATGAGHSVQVAGTSTETLNFDAVVHSGTGGTAAATGVRTVADSGGTPSSSVCTISDDGLTLTFEGYVTGAQIDYIPGPLVDLDTAYPPVS